MFLCVTESATMRIKNAGKNAFINYKTSEFRTPNSELFLVFSDYFRHFFARCAVRIFLFGTFFPAVLLSDSDLLLHIKISFKLFSLFFRKCYCDIIHTLTENNEALNLRVNTLTNKLTEKEEEIDNLTSDNNNLKSELTKWKNKFFKIINFIKNRLLRPKDKDRYNEFTIDLYTHNALDQETFDDIKNTFSKDKQKDNFER